MKPPLSSLQQWMHNALIFPNQTSADDAALHVEASSRLGAAQRLAIYQRSYIIRILSCVKDQFPALCHALGEELFTDFAREYLEACPPQSYTLYDLGRRFPDYLEQTRPDREQAVRETWIDFMVDLAHYERQLFVLFDAPGQEGNPYANEHVPDHRLRLQPCCALGDYRFPVAWYYHQVREGNAPPLPPQEQSLVALVRKDYMTHTIPLTAQQHTFLTRIAEGKSIEEALRLVAQRWTIPIESVVDSWNAPRGVRKRWVEAGFFVEGIGAEEFQNKSD